MSIFYGDCLGLEVHRNGMIFVFFSGRGYPKTQFIASLHLKIRMWSPGSPALEGREVFSLEFPYGVQERAFSNKLVIARRDQPLLWEII